MKRTTDLTRRPPYKIRFILQSPNDEKPNNTDNTTEGEKLEEEKTTQEFQEYSMRSYTETIDRLATHICLSQWIAMPHNNRHMPICEKETHVKGRDIFMERKGTIGNVV
ncbi:MAG: hypothetical protein LUQ31_00600 [Methanoregula sp.]|nr:hypothetical protein [Methanoregula sp.]